MLVEKIQLIRDCDTSWSSHLFPHLIGITSATSDTGFNFKEQISCRILLVVVLLLICFIDSVFFKHWAETGRCTGAIEKLEEQLRWYLGQTVGLPLFSHLLWSRCYEGLISNDGKYKDLVPCGFFYSVINKEQSCAWGGTFDSWSSEEKHKKQIIYPNPGPRLFWGAWK